MKTKKELEPCICGSFDHKNHPTETPENQKPVPHTPTPWKIFVGKIYFGLSNIYLESEKGYTVGRLEGIRDVIEADAAFIVKAVNCHQELLLMLNKVRETLAKEVYECGQPQSWATRLDDLIAFTLAKAEVK